MPRGLTAQPHTKWVLTSVLFGGQRAITPNNGGKEHAK